MFHVFNGFKYISRTTQIVGEEIRCRHMGYSFRLADRITHITAFVTSVVEHCLERDIMQLTVTLLSQKYKYNHTDTLLNTLVQKNTLVQNLYLWKVYVAVNVTQCHIVIPVVRQVSFRPRQALSLSTAKHQTRH